MRSGLLDHVPEKMMAELEIEKTFSPNIVPSQKKVLVCFGERKREVSFSSEGGNGELLKQTQLVFRDIDQNKNLVLQLKSEEWDGLFLDVTDNVSVADKSVLRAVLPNQPTASASASASGSTLREESRSVTSKAVSGLKRISKTSGACAKVLATIFPSTKSVPPKDLNVFDPLDDCVAQSAQNKKKSTRVKSISVKVILVPGCSTLVLPKGRKRLKLIADKRIEAIEIKRSMSPADVQNRIKRGFKHLNLQNWEYLVADAGKLSVSTNQAPGGEIVDRRGGLYIREKEEKTATVIASTFQGTSSSTASTSQGTASIIAFTSQGTSSSIASTSASIIASTSQGTSSSIASTSASIIASTSQGTSSRIASTTSPSIASASYLQEISTPILKDDASSIMSSDEELPPAFLSRVVPGKVNESVEQTRMIVAEQDHVYEEGLRIDQSKERKRLWTEMVQASKISLREKLTSTNPDDGKQIYMRLPNGDRVGSTFSNEASCQVLYEYVFAMSDLEDPYGIFCMFPRSIVTTDQTIADVQGILIVDERNGYFDPVSLVHRKGGVCVPDKSNVPDKSDVLSKGRFFF
ncbi:uncharacterized protein LOC135339554 isoform X2 [Halichondria panicea]|uniref:uncharacterized protein LOC135339554 isoform X2 n=1 Tax=Halichondria panicea TaxID=6063 RepID=UPI00312B5CE7